MRPGLIIAGIAALAALGFGAYMVDLDVTEEASLPDVDVSIEGGKLPEVEADAGDMDVGSEEVTVTVPTVEIETPEEESTDDRIVENN